MSFFSFLKASSQASSSAKGRKGKGPAVVVEAAPLPNVYIPTRAAWDHLVQVPRYWEDERVRAWNAVRNASSGGAGPEEPDNGKRREGARRPRLTMRPTPEHGNRSLSYEHAQRPLLPRKNSSSSASLGASPVRGSSGGSAPASSSRRPSQQRTSLTSIAEEPKVKAAQRYYFTHQGRVPVARMVDVPQATPTPPPHVAPFVAPRLSSSRSCGPALCPPAAASSSHQVTAAHKEAWLLNEKLLAAEKKPVYFSHQNPRGFARSRPSNGEIPPPPPPGDAPRQDSSSSSVTHADTPRSSTLTVGTTGVDTPATDVSAGPPAYEGKGKGKAL
ncbi:hypothetical protein B0A49_06353 [Cryomyces minteri]|uniref:Uncharacterized protein n=1 Tax=Cryomyces minteri TaxID=331657 RepID=A0A4U0XCZ7_9PEZI|nr:hypothetical protein B0A49_06353 [Cryomyces minteri]